MPVAFFSQKKPISLHDFHSSMILTFTNAQPCLPDSPSDSSRRRSCGGPNGQLLTLKSRGSIDAMAADPHLSARYPSLQHFSSHFPVDSQQQPINNNDSNSSSTSRHLCDCKKSEIACWTFTVVCVFTMMIGVILYLFHIDGFQVG